MCIYKFNLQFISYCEPFHGITLTSFIRMKLRQLYFITRKLNLRTIPVIRQYSQPSYIHQIGKTPLRAVSIGTVLEETANKYGKREGVVSQEQNKILSFKDILDEADKFAAGLQELGVQRGDRIGIWAPNLVEWYITFLACARGGYIISTLNPAYEPSEIEYCLNKVGIKVLICSEGFKKSNYYELLQEIHPTLPDSDANDIQCVRVPSLKNIIFISDKIFKGTLQFEQVTKLGKQEIIQDIRKGQHLINPDSGFIIQFTSGTTGKPKATLASHFNIVNNALQIAKRFELDKKYHRVCLQAPLFHGLASTISAMAALTVGATEIFAGTSYNPITTLKTCEDEGCTVIHGTPTMYVDLINVQEKHNFKLQLERCIIGGAPCSPELFRKIKNVLKIPCVQSVYGLTETTSVVFQSFPEDVNDEHRLTETVGHVGDHIEAKVIDENGNTVPMGVPGELCIRGYATVLEYWGDEEKTKELIGPDRWLTTGDKFVLNTNGYGKIVGRIKDMIIRGGENIFPKEIEDFLNSHPNVIESQVVGVPDERMGEEIYACLRLKEGTSITLEELKQFCIGKIAKFKIPSYMKIFEEFPKTASGKVQKYKLKEDILRNMS